MAAACLALGLLAVLSAPARAQGITPGKATPQAVTPAPQSAYAAPQARYGTPQSFASGQYASPQASSPCACYYPQGFCPFPSGNCWTFPQGNCGTFPQGNCIAVRPSSQWWPTGSSQLGFSQETNLGFPAGVIGD